MSTDGLTALLAQGMQQLNCSADVTQLLEYAHLLHKWNQTYNLTAVRDLPSIITRHILDSLAIYPWLYGNRLIDVGTGAGLPGIPLAIAFPSLSVTLIDSNGKKIQFLHEVKRLLSLSNIAIIESRVEEYQPSPGFDTITSRAFSDIKQMIKWTQHLLNPQGVWLAMKGRAPVAELDMLRLPHEVIPYSVPGNDGERCCVIIKNTIEE